MKTLKFYLTNRFILFVLFISVFILINFLYTQNIFPSTETKDIWFYSGLFMILFSTLFIEPFYTSPKNVITNTIPLLLVYISIKDTFIDVNLYYFSLGLVLLLLVLSIISISLYSENQSSTSKQNKFAEILKNMVVILGQAKILYSIVFISILFFYKAEILKDISEGYFYALILLWGLLLVIDPKQIHNKFIFKKISKNGDAIGEIIGVQSKKIFLVRLLDDRRSIKKFDIVNFIYAMQDSDEHFITGIVFDTYLLNSEKWAKVLELGQEHRTSIGFDRNTVYKVTERSEVDRLTKKLNLEKFVGVVIEKSSIGLIKFEYCKKTDDIQEGDLLELRVGNRRLFYQVIAGTTESERIENKNETGYIEGDAIQLGEWHNESMSFQKFGWVPTINTPIFVADTSDIVLPDFNYPDFKLGLIPNTQLPSIINLDEAVSHHTAFLGITGSGKSFIAKEIIDQIRRDTIVICVDFTGEWKKRMDLVSLNSGNINDFLDRRSTDVGLVELPVVSNTKEVIQSTETFISTVFSKAKEAYDANNPMKICLILEEAHTIVPEGTFLGVNDWDSKAVVNKIGQVALQGRKYGVGLFVIAQRTANVSKTVLTQCNTIICFQAFDETSFAFLGNYVGKKMIEVLPNLKKFHAVVSGKAIRSNMPMIVNLERE